MAAWTVSGPGGTATFDVVAGELEVKRTKVTGVLYPLRGQSPIVQSGVTRVASLTTPDWLTTTNSQHSTLMNVLTTSGRLTITTDTGETYFAVVSGDVVIKTEDTPTRYTSPRRRYTVPLIGVS